MGTWGTAISSNDTYADIYGEFFDLYNEGHTVAEISKKIISANQDIINKKDCSNDFWFAVAKAQWECKQLDKELLDRVTDIIKTGADLEVWRESGSNEKDIAKRKNVLDKFLANLQTERPKAKTRKKKIIRQPVFEKGDCLTFKLANGNYGGAVVLESIKDSSEGCNLIATTRINLFNKPTKRDFEQAEVLLVNYANWDNKPSVRWYYPIRHKQTAHLIEKVGQIDVETNYDIDNYFFGFVADFDIWMIEIANKQFKSEETKPRPTTKLAIKELTLTVTN